MPDFNNLTIIDYFISTVMFILILIAVYIIQDWYRLVRKDKKNDKKRKMQNFKY